MLEPLAPNPITDTDSYKASHWLQYPPGDMITAEYGAKNGGAKLVFSQWKTGGPDLFSKTLSFNTTAEPAVVDGNPGLWISGGDHAVFYLAPEDTGAGANHWSQRGYLALRCSPNGRTRPRARSPPRPASR